MAEQSRTLYGLLPETITPHIRFTRSRYAATSGKERLGLEVLFGVEPLTSDHFCGINRESPIFETTRDGRSAVNESSVDEASEPR